MLHRLIRYQLLLLFFLTVSSLIYFYNLGSLPDSAYSISSLNPEINWLKYFFFSLVYIIGFYSGVWVFIPLLFSALLYGYTFSKRHRWIDLFVPICLFGFFFILSVLCAPEFVGEGARYSINQLLTFWGQIGALLATGIVGFWGVFNLNLGHVYQSIKNFLSRARVVLKMISKKVASRSSKRLPESTIKVGLRSRLITRLKGLKETKIEKTFVRSLPAPEPAAQMSVHEELVEALQHTDPQVQRLPLEDKNQKREVIHKTIDKKRVAYQSTELIACIGNRKGPRGKVNPESHYFEEIMTKLEEKLAEFKVDGSIVNVIKGPVVDTFEVELGAGVKVSKITSISEDLSLALCGAPLRIVYPMRGKTTVGIEVPRNPREIIYLDQVLESKRFGSVKAQLPLAFGKSAFGETFIVDLSEMPHMLVAGATGAGKSVFINTLLVSLLVKKSPDKLKLILIDPKQLELAIYSSLPHLLLPVVTDPKRASLALLWTCEEMERRYTLMKELGVRNILGFNAKIKETPPSERARLQQYYTDGADEGFELPYIVVIIDEFADLILTPKAGKEIENNVCRLAAKARAAGIHLVVATQRPSVDVITGLIKNNFPTRVSFRVTSPMDSRTILNTMGAEKLLGKGDMLYKHGIETTRVHGAYVDEYEIEFLTNKLAEIPSKFCAEAEEFVDQASQDSISLTGGLTSMGHEVDEYFNDAVKLVLESRSASASMLQRRLKIGYNRAANLVEMMENKGLIGPQQGSKPREVLMSSEEPSL